jgi:hypothetical protein
MLANIVSTAQRRWYGGMARGEVEEEEEEEEEGGKTIGGKGCGRKSAAGNNSRGGKFVFAQRRESRARKSPTRLGSGSWARVYFRLKEKRSERKSE